MTILSQHTQSGQGPHPSGGGWVIGLTPLARLTVLPWDSPEGSIFDHRAAANYCGILKTRSPCLGPVARHDWTSTYSNLCFKGLTFLGMCPITPVVDS